MTPIEAQTKFHEFSRKVVSDFLQTALVVDDKAETNIFGNEASPKVLELISSTGKGARPSSSNQASITNLSGPQTDEVKSEESTTPAASTIVKANLKEDTELLAIKKLNQEFAKKGVVCGFLRPVPTGQNRREIIKSAKITAARADVVILDWKMEDGDLNTKHTAGYTARTIIKSILAQDRGGNNTFQAKGRLRLIIIYSQSTDLAKIIQNIAKSINTGNSGMHFTKEDAFTLTCDSTRICAFKKSGGTTPKKADPLFARTLNIKQLTERIISEFTIITEGLLSNVAIMGLGLLRRNTHKILQKFSSDLDAPYLTHRAWTEPVEEAQSHPIALLSSEIHDVLEGHAVSDALSPEQIELWVRSLPKRVNSDFNSKLTGFNQDRLLSSLENMVIHGPQYEHHTPAWKSFLGRFKKNDKDSIITNLMISSDTGKKKDREFAMLTTIRSHYNTPPPYLNLGTVIVKVSPPLLPNYYVCIQPVCDCVRLKSERKFPFLKLDISKDGKIDLIIKDKDELLELTVNYKPYELENFIFQPEPKSKQILAEQEGKDWFFTGRPYSESLTNTKRIKYYWLADLKFAHAQRIVENFGSQISRVGLMESDWLRRMAG